MRTLKLATELVIVAVEFETTRLQPAEAAVTFPRVKVLAVAPAMFASLNRHWKLVVNR